MPLDKLISVHIFKIINNNEYKIKLIIPRADLNQENQYIYI